MKSMNVIKFKYLKEVYDSEEYKLYQKGLRTKFRIDYLLHKAYLLTQEDLEVEKDIESVYEKEVVEKGLA